MADDDDTQSLQPPGDSLPPAHSSPPIAPRSPLSNTLALVVPSSVTGCNKNGRGRGRSDIWSDEATTVLINAWGNKVSEQAKGHLKLKQWKEVAEIVNKSGQVNNHKTHEQCTNRIDTVKKMFKKEKAKNGPSKWKFFKKLERLIEGTTRKAHKGTQILQQGNVKRSSDSMPSNFRKRKVSESAPSDDSDESRRPRQPPKRLKTDKTGESGVGEELAKAMQRFAETYEKMETKKIKQKEELGKERMKFDKEMELQKRKFLKPYLETFKKNQEEERRRKKDH